MPRNDPPLLLALWVVRATSVLVPRADRARWRLEWEAELVYWWRERSRTGLADCPKLARRVVIAMTDALRVRFQGGFGPTRDSPPSRRGSRGVDLLQDARFALRGWRKHPVQTAAILLTLGLGIGANTAVFSVINAVLLNPLPFPTVDRMFEVNRRLVDVGAVTQLPNSELQEVRRRSRTLERLEALDTRSGELAGAATPETVRIGAASVGLFDALGLAPVRGRHFASEDAQPDAQPVVLVGERAWRARFGGGADVLGRVVELDGAERVVVGVIDASIERLRADIDFWIPLDDSDPAAENSVLAWRRPDVSAEQATAEMESIEFRDPRLGRVRPRLSMPGERVGRDTRALLYSAFMAASIVLLIASVNVAHLMLARSAARRGDLAVRKALGASRARLARTVLVESALLAAGGALFGALLAAWSMDVLAALQPQSLRVDFGDVRVDRAVLAYALIVLLLAMGITSLTPMMDSWRFRPHAAMRGSSVTVAHGGGRFVRQGLLTAEVALSVTLLVGAGVLLHSLLRLQRLDPGYEPDGLLMVELELADSMPGAAERAASFARIREVVGALPGVQTATVAFPPPGHDMVFVGSVEVERTGEVHERVMASFTWAGSGYFDALRVPLLEGRDFGDADASSRETPVIVSRSFAESLFPGRSAVGQRFRRLVVAPGSEYVVVGVVADARQTDPLQRSPFDDQQIYGWLAAEAAPGEVDLLIRTAPGFDVSPTTLAERLRPLGIEVEGDDGFVSIREHLSWFLDRPRFNAILFGAFAVVALALALVGLYGVVSHAVERRTREMAIRVAVGASASDVRRLILLQGMAPVSAGILLGLAGATGAVRVITGLVYLVNPVDPPVFAVVPVLVLGVTLAAIWLPARRATRADPAAVIRSET